jgi:uncharacterized protein YjiS (DUF1127 family)
VRIRHQLPGGSVSPFPTTYLERLPDTSTYFRVDGASPDAWPSVGGPRANERTPPPPRTDDGVPHRAARGLLYWLKELIIEGLAAYGYALYPCFIESGEAVDIRAEERHRSHRVSHPDPEDKSQSREMLFGFEDHARIRHPVAPTLEQQFLETSASAPEELARPEIRRNCSRTWKPNIASALFRFWSRTRQKQKQRAMIRGLEALDDRTLNDFGIPRGQIEYAVSHARQDE